MRQLEDIKVVLQTPEGKYLAGSWSASCFVQERARAFVFDYLADRVEQQIAMFRNSSGVVFRAVPLAATEVYETCDVCQRLVMPRDAYFSGCQFFCPECKADADAKPQLDRLAA